MDVRKNIGHIMNCVINGYNCLMTSMRLRIIFSEKNYRNIAIYGVGQLANRLIEELEDTEIKVQYGKSKKNKNINDAFIDILGLDEENSFDNTDRIVVTPINLYEEIYVDLTKKAICDIISLEDVIFGV